LDVRDLKTYFFTVEGTAKAVDDVSFFLDKGETLGLVGESGCGKSVTALSIMRLVPTPPGRIVQGRILYDGKDLFSLPASAVKRIRGNRISMIFQEPMTSLNPVYTIGDQIAEMFQVHKAMNTRESWDHSIDILRKVQIPSPEKRAHDYPHQMSGGMRQRAMIAMALACKPEILIADEPTTALDVTIQAQIIDLMLELKQDFGAAILMISHNLGVIAEIARRVVVMYAGEVVEAGRTLLLFREPAHPYTQGLLRSVPRLGERSTRGRRRLEEIPGIVPNLYELPAGCNFHPRCSRTFPICRERKPALTMLEDGRLVRCWLYEDP